VNVTAGVSSVRERSGRIDPDFWERSLTLTKRFVHARALSFFFWSKSYDPSSLFTRWRHPYRKCWIKIHILCGTFAVKFWYRIMHSKLVSVSSLKIAANEHTSFTVAISLFYESALGSKELDSERERSWRWQDWSRALLQKCSLTNLAPENWPCGIVW